jgi:hypothetical protein
MTGWKLTAAKLTAIVGLLIAGIGVSAAFADSGNGNGNGPPTTVPGSPGDDCSHGNSAKDCRPDPNEHGKDCDDHGNARGNEDHCTAVDTPTTTETTTTSTTTSTSTSTSTPTTTTTTQTTTTSGPPGNPPSPPGNGGSPGPSGDSGSSSASTPPVTTPPVTTPPVTKPGLQKELAQQVKGAEAGPVSHAHANPKELPFTGFPAWAIALIGSMLMAAGLGLRRLATT